MTKTHQPCVDCGSSDALTIYEDGHTHCFSCGKTTHTEKKEFVENTIEKSLNIRPLPTEYAALTDRRISKASAEKYGVTSVTNEQDAALHVYPYYNKDGIHIANKVRRRGPEKGFLWEGDVSQATLFGQNLFPAGSGKQITVVEGECDALAAFEMSGSRYPVVSVHSASTAPKNCAENFEYLNSFEQIVICFDKDEAKVAKDGTVHYPGQEAAIACATMFPIGKVRVLTLQEHKDANDYLIAGKAATYIREWWNAPYFTPTGLKLGKDMWDEIITPKNYETIDYPWKGMNDATYGIRLSEFVLVMADTGVGKTTFFKEIEHFILRNSDKGVGFLHLEEPNSDTALGLMSISADKPLHLPDVREHVSNDELRKYYDDTVNSDRVVIWDHFGSNDIHEVLAKIRHMHALGCKYIFLDHLSIIVSDQSGDERKQLDEISTKLKTLCMELNIAVICIIHTNRMGTARGSAGPEKLANIFIQLSRDKTDPNEWRRNVTRVVVEKNRFCGRTGPYCWLFYQPETGRMIELDKEQVITYESGGSTQGAELWL
jgi:Autographiviridae DNA primase/helicase